MTETIKSKRLEVELNDSSIITREGETVSDIPGGLIYCTDLDGNVFVVPVELLIPYPDQPRNYFPDEDVESLKKKLLAEDQQMPIVAAPYWSGEYGGLRFIIIDGETRYRAMVLGGIEEAMILVQTHLTEEAVYKAAASTHKDPKSLDTLDRVLMHANLYQIATREAGHLTVKAYANDTEGVSYSDVRNALAINDLPEEILNLAKMRAMPYRSILYLAHRFKGPEVRFPTKKLNTMLRAAIERKEDNRLKDKEVKKVYVRALISTGQTGEAITTMIKEQIEAVLSPFRKFMTEVDELLELSEDDEPNQAMVDVVKGRKDLNKLLAAVRSGIRKLRFLEKLVLAAQEQD